MAIKRLNIFKTLCMAAMLLACSATTPTVQQHSITKTPHNTVETPAFKINYATLKDMSDLESHPGMKYILFSAPWCGACATTTKAIHEGGMLSMMHILNVDEPWVAYIATKLKIKSLPTLLVLDGKNDAKHIITIPHKIVMHMLLVKD
jgi:thioredoxin-like negative regulator of GroEL